MPNGKRRRKRIGVLTGGGDCPGLNAVLRAVTKSAQALGYEVIGFRDGFEGLINWTSLVLTNAMVSSVLTQGGTLLGTSNKSNPYQWVPEGKQHLKPRDVSERAIRNFKRRGLESLIVTGGDGTMSIAARLSEDGVPIVGIPKTIDNDLPGTDVTFGFETAVITATEAIDKVHTTAQSHHRVMVVEVMGRYAGWIALYSGVAGGGDVILIPEIPYNIKCVNERILERSRQGKRFSIIVAAEGAKPKGGELTVSAQDKQDAWLCYYLTPVCARVWTEFTPQPPDFWKWVEQPPRALFAQPEVQDILTALDENIPIALVRHNRQHPFQA